MRGAVTYRCLPAPESTFICIWWPAMMVVPAVNSARTDGNGVLEPSEPPLERLSLLQRGVDRPSS